MFVSFYHFLSTTKVSSNQLKVITITLCTSITKCYTLKYKRRKKSIRIPAGQNPVE